VTDETKKKMKRVRDDMPSGKFASDWMLENKVNQTWFKATRAKLAAHPIEDVGAKLRDMMPYQEMSWIKKRALVDKTKLSFGTAFAQLTGLFVMAGLVPTICGFDPVYRQAG
jgi:ribosomal protein S25